MTLEAKFTRNGIITEIYSTDSIDGVGLTFGGYAVEKNGKKTIRLTDTIEARRFGGWKITKQWNANFKEPDPDLYGHCSERGKE